MLDSEQAVFSFACELHSTLKEKFFLNPKDEDDDPFESSQIHVLIANPTGIYGLYDLRSVQAYTRFYSFGTGYKYALGAMYSLYDSKLSAEEIAKAGIEAAAEFDDGTALPLKFHTMKMRKKGSNKTRQKTR